MGAKFYKILLVLIFVFNLVDAISTSILVQTGKVLEANPLMDFLIQVDISLFLVFKIILGTFIIIFFWDKHKEKLARILIWGPFIAYSLIIVDHAYIWYVGLTQGLLFGG